MSCPNCFTGAVHNHATPTGTEETLYGYRTYVSSPPAGSTSASTIIFFTDAFGLNLVNNKILADRYAKETGMRVLTPDIIPGGGAPVSAIPPISYLTKGEASWWAYLNPITFLYKASAVFNTLTAMVPFIIRASPQKAYPEALKYARAVKADLPPTGKLGVAGFCWGGFQSTKLSGESANQTEATTTPLIDAQFCAHPSALKAPDDFVESISKFKTPYSCAVSPTDLQFPEQTALDTEAALKQKIGEGNYEFRMYPGCYHGWAVRAFIPEDQAATKGYEDAANQAVTWFKKYL